VIRLSAPAKLNLFLHVTGQREDGYHLLQSLFCLIDWEDRISLWPASGGCILRRADHPWPAETDLTLRAAHALRDWAVRNRVGQAEQLGCEIQTEKHIPAGAGLGGGSSDAASCLLGLRALWRLPIDSVSLHEIALGLGADVPFFLLGGSALVEGIGERLSPLSCKAQWFVVAVPPVHVPTAAIFRDAALVRNQPAVARVEIEQACQGPVWQLGINNLEAVACARFPEVQRLVQQMHGARLVEGLGSSVIRMSGSGGSVFASCLNAQLAERFAEQLQKRVEPGTQIRVCRQLVQHPARALLQ